MAASSISSLLSWPPGTHTPSFPPPPFPASKRTPFCACRLLPRPPSSSSSPPPPHHNTPSGVSRRQMAALIALFLHPALTPSSNADTDTSRIERKDSAEVHAVEFCDSTVIQKVVELDGSNVFSSFGDTLLNDSLLLGVTAAPEWESKGLLQTTGNNNGFGLFCSAFVGLLFWQKRQARNASVSALEDMQAKINKAEAELCSKTNSAVRLKLDRERALKQASKDQEENEVLLYQTISMKSKAMELQRQLEIELSAIESLTNEENSLKVNLKEVQQGQALLMENFHSEQRNGQMLEAQLIDLEPQTKQIAEESASLRLALEDLENVCNNLSQSLYSAKSSLNHAKGEILKLEIDVSLSGTHLKEKDCTMQTLTEELAAVVAENGEYKEKLNEIYEHLKYVGQSFQLELDMIREKMVSKEEEVNALSSEVAVEFMEIEKLTEVVGRLITERSDLENTLSDAQNLVKQLTIQLTVALQNIDAYGTEVISLKKKQTACKEVRQQLEETLDEVQGEANTRHNILYCRLNEEKGVTTQLSQKLNEAKQSLWNLEQEAVSNERLMASSRESYGRLKEDLLTVSEMHETVSVALKKEKRAVAASKKKLTTSEQTLIEENKVLSGLNEDLEQVRRHLQDGRARLSSSSRQLEAANGNGIALEGEISLLQQHLLKERTLTTECEKKDDRVTAAKGKRPRKNPTAKRVRKLNETILPPEGQVYHSDERATPET